MYIAVPAVEKWSHLGSLANVFQAETFAASTGMLKLLPSEVERRKITLLSDSEAMIKAMASPVTTSKLVKEFKCSLNHQWG